MDAKLDSSRILGTPERPHRAGDGRPDERPRRRRAPRNGRAYTLAAALAYENGPADFDTSPVEDMEITEAKRRFLLYLRTEGFDACDRARRDGSRMLRSIPRWWEDDALPPQVAGEPPDDNDSVEPACGGGASGRAPK